MKRHSLTINWGKTYTMVFSRESRSWGCTARASKGDRVPRGEVK